MKPPAPEVAISEEDMKTLLKLYNEVKTGRQYTPKVPTNLSEKEYKKLWNKLYYNENKEKIQARSTRMKYCECCRVSVQSKSFALHTRSKMHIKNVAESEETSSESTEA